MKKGLFSTDIFEEITASLHKQVPLYRAFLIDGTGTIKTDVTPHAVKGKMVLFTTPFQAVSFKDLVMQQPLLAIAFHGDFYCIEYHKQEVACNGLLFNNIYERPLIPLSDALYEELQQVWQHLHRERQQDDPYSAPVLKACLQLFLAIASKIKRKQMPLPEAAPNAVHAFKTLLEAEFIHQRSSTFYADRLALSGDVFHKKCKAVYGKPPSQLIQERVILEAKKLLHLTYKSVKEIAATLGFEDEHYFSRYFKKGTGVSPTVFRKQAGISIVADLSTR